MATGGHAMHLLKLPLDGYMFRPGFIQPMHGVKSKTRLYRLFYAVTSPLYPVRSAIDEIRSPSMALGGCRVQVLSAALISADSGVPL